jgi:hypothetical protein
VAVHDLLVFIAPLYIDSLPYNVIELLEIMASRAERKHRNKNAVLIMHSGLEAKHNSVAVDIFRCFCARMGYHLDHAFVIGHSGTLNGIDLMELSRYTKNIRKALQLTAAAISERRPVPEAAKKWMAKPLMPLLVFLLIGKLGMKKSLREKSFKKGLDDLHRMMKPFYS